MEGGEAIESFNPMEFDPWTLAKVCWFLEPELAKEVRCLHSLVRNAITKGQGLPVGTGTGSSST
jgi:hypothetical protein